jgi:hypothetical protein
MILAHLRHQQVDLVGEFGEVDVAMRIDQHGLNQTTKPGLRQGAAASICTPSRLSPPWSWPRMLPTSQLRLHSWRDAKFHCGVSPMVRKTADNRTWCYPASRAGLALQARLRANASAACEWPVTASAPRLIQLPRCFAATSCWRFSSI